MPDCESVAGKCGDLQTEALDLASELYCDIAPETAHYINAAVMLKLICIMNKIAQKTHPLGDVIPPEESLDLNTEYWLGCMSKDFGLCDVFSMQSEFTDCVGSGGSGEGGSGSGEIGSGSGGGDACSCTEWNIKITPPGESAIFLFDNYVCQDTLCLSVIEDEAGEFSADFEAIDKVIPKGSRIDFLSGDCICGLGFRLDLLGYLPLECN